MLVTDEYAVPFMMILNASKATIQCVEGEDEKKLIAAPYQTPSKKDDCCTVLSSAIWIILHNAVGGQTQREGKIKLLPNIFTVSGIRSLIVSRGRCKPISLLTPDVFLYDPDGDW